MNFTGEIKRELRRSVPQEKCCRLALFAAALDTGGDRDFPRGFSFTGENEEGAEYLFSLAEELFGVRMTLEGAVRDPKHGRDKLTFAYFGPRAEEIGRELSSRSPAEALPECCAGAYLRGAFLYGGSCTLPREGKKTGYHLEISFGTEEKAVSFLSLLERFQLIGSLIPRGDRSVVYFKSREGISDFLSVLGATGALNKLESVTSLREENNNRNRVENCTAGNADRAAIASAQQIVAFGEMKARGIFPSLPEPLRFAAEARIAEPALSLSELAERTGLSKSCLNHRLRKLMKLYEEIDK